MKIVPKAEAESTPKPPKKTPLALIILLVIILTAAVSGSLGFWRGAMYGKQQATKETVRTLANIANPLNLLSNNPLFPNTIVGKVSDRTNSGMSVRLINGDVKKVVFDSKTQVTKGSSTLTLNDIKKDANLTVFTRTKDNKSSTLLATRILIR